MVAVPIFPLLTYDYDSGGLLRKATGIKGTYTYEYIKQLEYDKFEQRTFIEYGNNIRTNYTYDPFDRRLNNLKSGKGDGNLFQNLNYGYDDVGNILSLANDVPVPSPSQFGGPTTQTYTYDDLYRLTSASGAYNFNPDKTDRYSMAMAYDSVHNIITKQQAHEIVQPSNTPITQKKTTYAWAYDYGTQPHAPTHIGERAFRYDANGNQLGWTHDKNGTSRTITWDEENRIQSIFDNGHEKTYKYNDQGERIIKRGPQGETVYVNQYFTIRNKEIGTKHVYAGTTRVISKLMKQDKPGSNPQGNTPVEKDVYFYHPDHLGSSSYITDTNGKLYEHLEYFPFGETWVEEASNTQRTPYLFTGKELDEETGLYYFGARYYDPRTSVWQSADPIDRFTPKSPTIGLNLYQYGLFNPVRMTDPDGRLEYDQQQDKFTISKGDTLTSISEKTGFGIGKLLAANPNIKNQDKIYAGKNINIPSVSIQHNQNKTAASGKVGSGVEIRNALHYFGGSGETMEIGKNEFSRIYEAGKIDGMAKPMMFESGNFGFKGNIDLYASDEFDYAYGEATIYFNKNLVPSGFYDRYNMNSSTHRSIAAEKDTALGKSLGQLFGGKPYDIRAGEQERRP